MAKAFLPQSTHDVIAIPLMKSAIAIDIECLQFGHLYCLVEIIWAIRHYHASGHYPEFHSIFLHYHFYVQRLSPFWLYCILFRGQSKSLLSGCTVILSPHNDSFHGYLNRANKQNLINSFGFQEEYGNNYLENSLWKIILYDIDTALHPGNILALPKYLLALICLMHSELFLWEDG